MKVSSVNKLHIFLLALFFKLFQPLIRFYYLKKGYWQTSGPSLSIIFFIRTGKNLIGLFSNTLRQSGYPKVNLSYEELLGKVRSGYSFSRFGDGEFSIIKAKNYNAVYFDTATPKAKEALLRVLVEPTSKHMVGVIHEDVVASQLSFANALSQFKNLKSIINGPRMPLLAEYDRDMLDVYSQLCKRGYVFEAGLIRNTSHKQHEELWLGRAVLYVTGSKKTSEQYGYTVERLFSKATSVEVIETVTEQALSNYYDEILNKVISFKEAKSKMIIISLGMAGSVLAYDLSNLGYHAVDFGQPFVNYKK
jgi:hypothetical protein